MKNIITNLMMIIAIGIIIITIISCDNDIADIIGENLYYKYRWQETYYNGTGHSNKVILDSNEVLLDNGSMYIKILLILDNITTDAYDIRERFDDNITYRRLYYWLSFNYIMFSTNCKEVNKDMIVFPISISSPNWWPDDLKNSFFPRNRSKYKFYRCRASYAGAGLSFFQYFAFDNITKRGYYWNTLLEYTSEETIKKYYYAWEDFK
jgi:hypothetical protein